MLTDLSETLTPHGLTRSADDPNKYNEKYQGESRQNLVSSKYANPANTSSNAEATGLFDILEDAPAEGRLTPIQCLENWERRFNFIIIDAVEVDFDSFGSLLHISTESHVVLLRMTAQQAAR